MASQGLLPGEADRLKDGTGFPGLKIADFPESLHLLLHQLDDSGDGELDLEELTDMCTVYVDMKRAAKDGSIAIASLPKEIQPTLAVFDVDGDGSETADPHCSCQAQPVRPCARSRLRVCDVRSANRRRAS
jgi:hypothetical protein